MFRTALISAAAFALLASGSAIAAPASPVPPLKNPNCASLTNAVLKKACEQKPPPSCGDPSKPGNGNGNGNGNGQNNGAGNGNGNQPCPVSN